MKRIKTGSKVIFEGENKEIKTLFKSLRRAWEKGHSNFWPVATNLERETGVYLTLEIDLEDSSFQI